MNNMSIDDLLRAWADWANQNEDQLGCKSPSYELMKSAPHVCEHDKPRNSAQVVFISDDMALIVDKAVGMLAKHSILLWQLIRQRYQYGWSDARIAKSKKTTAYKIKALLERAIGNVEGFIITMTN